MDDVDALDMILVGDTLGMVSLGYDSTLPVTVDDMVHHTAAVNRAVDRAFLCTDLPFLSTAESQSHSVDVAKKLMQDGGAQAVKIEGGDRNTSIIDHLTDFDVPVVGHLGLTPQSVEDFGGYKIQAQSENDIKTLTREALKLEDSGILALVLECVPAAVARALTERLDVSTIGIGAGSGCDGQVLVWQDMMGMNSDGSPSFVKEYDSFEERLSDGVQSFCDDVRNRDFPDQEHSFSLSEGITNDDVMNWVNSVS
jgi:3-methyl-2-oxobutanoate hydroxymethyltransferase